MSDHPVRGLYVIIDPEACAGRDPVEVARLALEGGASIIQWRDKRRGKGEQLADARAVRELCANKRALFFANDHVDLALVCRPAVPARLGRPTLLRHTQPELL